MTRDFRQVESGRWNRDRLLEILEKFSPLKILVVGDVGVDRYTLGSVDRISPEAPVPIVAVQEEWLKLGLGANVADNVKALGATPLLSGVVGRDRAAEDFRSILKTSQMDERFIVEDPDRRTVLKQRIITDRQQLLRVDHESNHKVDQKPREEVLEKITPIVSQVDGIILQDYGKGMVTAELAQAIFRLAKSHGKTVFVDPHGKTPLEVFKGAGVFKPNLKEASELTGIAVTDSESVLAVGNRLLEKTGAQWVVVTRGGEGMTVFQAGAKECVQIPTYSREVYDVSGAGDTVVSVLALAMGAGANMEEAATLANLAAGVEIGKRGTATVSRGEIQRAMEFHSH